MDLMICRFLFLDVKKIETQKLWWMMCLRWLMNFYLVKSNAWNEIKATRCRCKVKNPRQAVCISFEWPWTLWLELNSKANMELNSQYVENAWLSLEKRWKRLILQYHEYRTGSERSECDNVFNETITVSIYHIKCSFDLNWTSDGCMTWIIVIYLGLFYDIC